MIEQEPIIPEWVEILRKGFLEGTSKKTTDHLTFYDEFSENN